MQNLEGTPGPKEVEIDREKEVIEEAIEKDPNLSTAEKATLEAEVEERAEELKEEVRKEEAAKEA